MKKILYLFVIAFAVMALVSCGRSEGKSALRDLEKIVEKAEKNKDKLSAEEWKELFAEFQEKEAIANEAAEKNELGITGKVKLLALTTRWAAAYGPRMFEDMASEMDEAGLNDFEGELKKMGGELKEMLKSLSEDSIMQEALEQDN